MLQPVVELLPVTSAIGVFDFGEGFVEIERLRSTGEESRTFATEAGRRFLEFRIPALDELAFDAGAKLAGVVVEERLGAEAGSGTDEQNRQDGKDYGATDGRTAHGKLPNTTG